MSGWPPSGPRAPFAVLIVSGGGFQGLAVARSLAAVSDVRIVVADAFAEPPTAALADEVVRVPRLDEPAEFATALLDLVAARSIRLVIPATERELTLLAELSPRLAALGARVAVSDGSALRTFGDRVALHEALQRGGLPVLERRDPRLAGVAQLPLLGKPRFGGWGGRQQRVVRSAAELAAVVATESGTEYLWQPFLEGFREHSIDFAVGFAGEVSPVVTRERLRTSGGFCVVARSSESEAVLELGEVIARFTAGLGGRGLFNAQVLEHDGRLSVSDLNPRIGTSAVFSLGAGVNLVEFLCRSAGARAGDGGSAPRRVRMTRLLVESFAPEPPFAARALLFDLDDTLLDHKRWIYAKLELLWQAQQARLPAREIFLRAAWRAIEEEDRSRTLDVLVRDLALPPELRDALIADYRRAEPATAPLYADVVGALAAFRDRGLRLGLVTDNPPESQRQKLARAGIAPLFDAVVFSREIGGEKPEPAGLLAAVERLGVAAAETAMVGDQPLRDGEAARAAGLGRFYWVRRGGGLFDVHAGLMQLAAPGLAQFTVLVRDLRELAEAIRPR